MSLHKVFVKIEILFKIRISISIIILLWISIPDLISYTGDTHQILFGSANSFESYCVHMKSPRTYVHPDIQTSSQTDRRKFCLLLLSFNIYKTWTFIKRREFFFFSLMRLQYFLFLHTPRMWWESKKITRTILIAKSTIKFVGWIFYTGQDSQIVAAALVCWISAQQILFEL